MSLPIAAQGPSLANSATWKPPGPRLPDDRVLSMHSHQLPGTVSLEGTHCLAHWLEPAGSSCQWHSFTLPLGIVFLPYCPRPRIDRRTIPSHLRPLPVKKDLQPPFPRNRFFFMFFLDLPRLNQL